MLLYPTKLKKGGELIAQVEPEDIIKFGLIPELVGRLPVVTTLQELDVGALVQILTVPKNALVKQYQTLFAMEGVELEVTPEALKLIAEKAIKRKTGARGLRSIIESVLMPIMFEMPSRSDIKKVILNEEAVLGGEPEIIS